MSSEIERKFLLPEAPARLSEAKAGRIEQGDQDPPPHPDR